MSEYLLRSKFEHSFECEWFLTNSFLWFMLGSVGQINQASAPLFVWNSVQTKSLHVDLIWCFKRIPTYIKYAYTVRPLQWSKTSSGATTQTGQQGKDCPLLFREIHAWVMLLLIKPINNLSNSVIVVLWTDEIRSGSPSVKTVPCYDDLKCLIVF